MSSTNRSAVRDAHISDYYKTPVNDVLLFLDNVNNIIIKGDVLDPCAGGVKDKETMSYVEALEKHSLVINKIDSIDIREDSCALTVGDYLLLNCKNKYDTIITNPPFALALDIIQKALNDIKPNGYVIMLLRLNFFGSDDRKPFFELHMPEYCFVHHKRISFGLNKKGKKSSDSIEYAHFIWKKDHNPEFTKLKVI